jgi:hypothetical protein
VLQQSVATCYRVFGLAVRWQENVQGSAKMLGTPR